MLTRLLTLCLSLTLINVAVAGPDASEVVLPTAAVPTELPAAELVVEADLVTEDLAKDATDSTKGSEKSAKAKTCPCAELDSIQQELRQQSASIEIQGRALTDKEFEQLGRHHSARFHLARAKSALGCASK